MLKSMMGKLWSIIDTSLTISDLNFNFTGAGVDIYVLDSGINYNHTVFGGRARFGGYDAFPEEGRRGRDCQGHGTHCAGLAVGRLTGVAYGANVYR